MSIDITFLWRCIWTLERALDKIGKHREKGDSDYEIYRSACVKEFELILEQSGKLLRKCVAEFYVSSRQVDRLSFKDLFRYAAKHGLIAPETVERWFHYRDVRNDTAREYGENYAEATLKLLPTFIIDAKDLAESIDPTDGK